MEVTTRNGKPVVNVKIRGWNLMEDAMRNLMAEEGRNERFPAFYESLPERVKEAAWDESISIGWDRLQELAGDIFPGKAIVYSEGRSGGWAVVEGLGDPEEWTEEEHKQWEEFEERARATAADVPYITLSLLYGNDFELFLDSEERQARRFIAYLEGKFDSLVIE